MKKYIPMWYDTACVQKTDPEIIANSEEEARAIAYSKYPGGRGPQIFKDHDLILYLKPVE